MKKQREALEMAIQLEREGQAFYKKAAARTLSEKGRAMFLSLADDEKRHEQILERQCNALTENQCFADIPEMGAVSADWDAPIFPKDASIFEKVVRGDASDVDALLFAIQAENKSFELYRKLAKETDDAAGQAMFRWLASVERGHFNQLMLNYESLLSSGAWAD